MRSSCLLQKGALQAEKGLVAAKRRCLWTQNADFSSTIDVKPSILLVRFRIDFGPFRFRFLKVLTRIQVPRAYGRLIFENDQAVVRD